MSTMPPEHTPAPARRARFIVAGAMILLGIGGLAAWGIASPGAVSYYATPTEVGAQGPEAVGRQLRIGGFVADGSLVRDGTIVRFTVTDGQGAVPVRYSGDVPDTLQDATDVVAEGTLASDGTLVADRVLAKCSSKFEPVEDLPERPARG